MGLENDQRKQMKKVIAWMILSLVGLPILAVFGLLLFAIGVNIWANWDVCLGFIVFVVVLTAIIATVGWAWDTARGNT